MACYDDPRIATFGLLLEAQADLVAVLGRELEEGCGLPLSSYEVLLRLGRRTDGRLRMSELAEAVALSASGLTRLVDRLEQEGLVARERCPNDRRGAFAVLTEEGAARLQAATEVHAGGVERHLVARLDPDELADLHQALGKLTRHRHRGDQRVLGKPQSRTPAV